MNVTHGGRDIKHEDGYMPAGYVQIPEDRVYEPEEWHNLRLCKLHSDLLETKDGDILPTAIWLELALAAYEREKTGYELITAFIGCYNEGLFPSQWILKGLYDRFVKWKSANLKGDMRTLDDIFNAGNKPDWKERVYESVYLSLQNNYLRLKYYFGLDNPRIWELLARQIEAIGIKGENEILHERKKFSQRAIEKLHKESKWGQRYKDIKKKWDEQKPCLSPDEAKEFLQSFPEDVQNEIDLYRKRLPTADYTTK